MKSKDNVELWSGELPGNCRPQTAGDHAAVERPSLVKFLLPAEQPRPLIIVLPGGGYAGHAPHEADPLAKWFNGLGLHAVVCRYRVHPWLHPSPLLDAQRAVRLARALAAEWRVDTQRIGILGFSAGGHLACSVANFGDDGDAAASDPVARQSSRVNALVACYPVISAGPSGHAGSFKNLLGDNPDPALKQRLSLENSVTSANPPAFIWHSADDNAVPVANSLLYAQALAAVAVSFSLHIYPHAPHGIGMGRDFPGTARGWTLACEAWLRELGWA
ncbi:MAG: alpha/beta hydrolase [Kiritimatiellae bacterium]|nr:alpha/beta hydrolase [Kiritimatiellia bacterium]